MATPTYYPGKVQDAKSVNHTPETMADLERVVQMLAAAAPEDLKLSRSDLIEHAWRKLRGMPVNPKLETRLKVQVDIWRPAEPAA